jgi:hypothetical protein
VRRKKTLPEGYASRLETLDAARDELAAARTLLANLDRGGRPAAIHLARSAEALARLALPNGEDGPPKNGPSANPLEDFVPPGANDRQRERWAEAIPVILECALPPPSPAAHRAADIERHARIVHDILDSSLLFAERELRSRLQTTRRPGVVVGAVAVLALLPRSPSRSSAARAPEQRAEIRSRVTLSEFETPRARGTPWDAPGNIVIPGDPGYLVVEMEEPARAPVVELSLDNNDRYRIEFLRGGTIVGEHSVGPDMTTGGLIVYRIEVPAEAVQAGYDAVRIGAVEGDSAWSVGHLRLLPDGVPEPDSVGDDGP